MSIKQKKKRNTESFAFKVRNGNLFLFQSSYTNLSYCQSSQVDLLGKGAFLEGADPRFTKERKQVVIISRNVVNSNSYLLKAAIF